MKTNIVIDISPPTNILQNSGSELWAKILLANQIAGFFKM